MRLDGNEVIFSKTIGFRYGNPAIDRNIDGVPVESNYVSFVHINDCEIYEKEEKKYYNPENASCIPISHGGTNYGYGAWKKRKSSRGIWVRQDIESKCVLVHEYAQCTVYYAYKGKVYTGSIRRPITEVLLPKMKI